MRSALDNYHFISANVLDSLLPVGSTDDMISMTSWIKDRIGAGCGCGSDRGSGISNRKNPQGKK